MKAKKISAVALAMAMLFNVGCIAAFAESNGLTVSSYEELVQFCEAVNSGNSYEGTTVTLTESIDLSDVEWTPVGNGTRSGTSYTGNSFKGVFDGQENIISGLTITTGTTVGLFGVLDGGTVKNLKLTDVEINAPAGDNVGAAVSVVVNGGTVDNVDVSGAVTGNAGVGGVVGRVLIEGEIKNCNNSAVVSQTVKSDGAGGIVGKAYYTVAGKEMTISNCQNSGAVSSPYVAGGIVGLSAANVIGCTNTADITGGNEAGGIVGEQVNYGEVSGNTNSGDISNTGNGTAYGGIIGWVRYQTSTANYSNNEVVSVTGNVNNGSINASGAALGAGGIIGSVYNQIIATDNENNADSISSKTFASGIVGAIQESEDNLVIDGKYIISDNVSTTASENITANCVAEIVYDNFSGRNENVTVENNLVFPTEDGVVFDGENYYSSLAAALKGVNGKDNAVLYCKPGADVGSMTHGHVCKNLTVYGNGAYISGGEQEFEIDTYLCTGAGGSALEGDVTLTVYELTGAGVWGQRNSEYTVNVEFIDCESMSRIYLSGTKGVNNITLTNCTATSNVGGECKVYSNANGEIVIDGCTFANVDEAINLNHKIAGTQKVTVKNCSFDTVGDNSVNYAAPVRVLSSVEGGVSEVEIDNCTFNNTVANSIGQDADILLDYGVGTTTVNVIGTDAKAGVETESDVITYKEVASTETVSISNKEEIVEEPVWETDSDAGFYYVGETKYGLMRFLFNYKPEAEITEVGIKYINAGNIGENVTGENASGASVSKEGAINTFYGDIVNIPETVESGTYYAAAYVITENGTVWSDIVDCSVNWKQYFKDYQPVTGGIE